MKISELLLEDVHDPKIDWNKFKLALAAHAAALGLEDYGRVDAIMFLGLAGDPNSQSVLDVKLKGPAKIGVADADSNRDLAFVHSGKNSKTAGEYYGVAYTDPNDTNDRGYQLRQQYEYGIIINQDFFNQASGEIDTPTLAHEAHHRGFDILSRIPQIRNAINPRTQKYLDELKTAGERIPGLGLEDTGERNFLEHLLIYSREVPNQIGPDDMFRSKEEVKMFRMMYQDIEQAANAYIQRYPVPKGGFELLRNEVDRLTPDNVKIKVSKDTSGKPVVTGALDQIKNTVKNIFNKGSSKNPSTKTPVTGKTGTTPAKPSSEKKSDPVPSTSQPSQFDTPDELDLVKKNAGLTAQTKNTYTVKPNDTLSKIAQTNMVSLPDLIAANPQIKNPDLIYAGDVITIPR